MTSIFNCKHITTGAFIHVKMAGERRAAFDETTHLLGTSAPSM